MTIIWRLAIFLGLIALTVTVAAADPAKIRLGYAATTDFASAFVAAEQGIFAKHGLDVSFVQLPQAGAAIPALVSGSLELGSCTPPAFLQAVEGDLDLVGIAGGSVMTKEVNDFTALVARNGSNIRSGKDLEGKTVGATALNGTLYILFLEWLEKSGVDRSKVRIVEIPFPQQLDALRSGQIDAAIPVDPFLGRIIGENVGYRVAAYMEAAPQGLSAVFYCGTRSWAEANATIVTAFRAAIVEAMAFMAANNGTNDVQVRADIAKYVKMPPEVMAKLVISKPEVSLTPAHLQGWYDLMKHQGSLHAPMTMAQLIAP
jgi:NitT/TauT family transport system substrate-binding protein